jgi:hypothetical protein
MELHAEQLTDLKLQAMRDHPDLRVGASTKPHVIVPNRAK